jgi:hypothetical protein
MAKAVHAPEGDFRDLGALLEWVRKIASSLASSLAPARTH